jgi:hypothetical protein
LVLSTDLQRENFKKKACLKQTMGALALSAEEHLATLRKPNLMHISRRKVASTQ